VGFLGLTQTMKRSLPKLHKFIGFLAPNINKGMKTAKLKKYIVPIEKIEKICNLKILY
jgi:DNA/RNA endonuclease G (NUC1)